MTLTILQGKTKVLKTFYEEKTLISAKIKEHEERLDVVEAK